MSIQHLCVSIKVYRQCSLLSLLWHANRRITIFDQAKIKISHHVKCLLSSLRKMRWKGRINLLKVASNNETLWRQEMHTRDKTLVCNPNIWLQPQSLQGNSQQAMNSMALIRQAHLECHIQGNRDTILGSPSTKKLRIYGIKESNHSHNWGLKFQQNRNNQHNILVKWMLTLTQVKHQWALKACYRKSENLSRVYPNIWK